MGRHRSKWKGCISINEYARGTGESRYPSFKHPPQGNLRRQMVFLGSVIIVAHDDNLDTVLPPPLLPPPLG